VLNWIGKLWWRLPCSFASYWGISGRENVPTHSTRRAKEEVPSGRSHSETVRTSKCGTFDRHLCSETTDHDRHGTCTGGFATQFLEAEECQFHYSVAVLNVCGRCSRNGLFGVAQLHPSWSGRPKLLSW